MSGALDCDPIPPQLPKEDREVLKKRLQDKMAWGTEQPELFEMDNGDNKKLQFKLPTKKEIRQELLTQIRERAEWLQEMEALGQAEPHRELVRDQIAQRARSLRALGLESQPETHRPGSCESSTSIQKECAGNVSAEQSVASSARPSADQGHKKTNSISPVLELKRGALENVSMFAAVTPMGPSPRRRC